MERGPLSLVFSLRLLMLMACTTYCSAAQLCSSYFMSQTEPGDHVAVLAAQSSCSSGVVHYAWDVRDNADVYLQMDVRCYNSTHSGAWEVSVPRVSFGMDGDTNYSVPPEFVGGDTRCVVRGCYKLFTGIFHYFTNNVTVDCFTQPPPPSSLNPSSSSTQASLPTPPLTLSPVPPLISLSPTSGPPDGQIPAGEGSKSGQQPVMLAMLAVMAPLLLVSLAVITCAAFKTYHRSRRNVFLQHCKLVFAEQFIDTSVPISPHTKIIFGSEETICDPLEPNTDTIYPVTQEGLNNATLSHTRSSHCPSDEQEVCGELPGRERGEEKGGTMSSGSQQSMNGEEEEEEVEGEATEEKKEVEVEEEKEQKKGAVAEREKEEEEEERKAEEEGEGEGENGVKNVQREKEICRTEHAPAYRREDDVTSHMSDYVQSVQEMSSSCSNWNHPKSLHSPPTGDYVSATTTGIHPCSATLTTDTVLAFQDLNSLPEIAQVALTDSSMQEAFPVQYVSDSTLPALPTTSFPSPSSLSALHVLPMPPTSCDAGLPTALPDLPTTVVAGEVATSEQQLLGSVCPSPVPSDSQDEIISSVLEWTVPQSSSMWSEGTSGTSLTSTETCSNGYFRMARHTEH